MRSKVLSAATSLVVLFALNPSAYAAKDIVVTMVRSTSAVNAGSSCIPKAAGRVTIHTLGPVETMHVEVTGLPANTGFDLFIIQVPNAPFGMSWYQGDVTTDSNGRGIADFVGRFSLETFIVAPGTAVAPVVHTGPFPDASSNPATNPVHMFHIGVWFDSPTAAANAGCPNTETPFNGNHTAGIQALSTRNFADTNGPLRQIH